jgi:nucleotide-binding universal stress UspA family protein
MLVPYDGSLHAHCALLEASERAVRDGAALTLLGIPVEPALPSLAPDVRVRALADAERSTYALLAQARAEVDPGVEVKTSVKRGEAATVIAGMARNGGYDLIVMGARSTGPFHSMRTGRTARAVRKLSSVPVVLTPAVPWRDRSQSVIGPLGTGAAHASSSGAIVSPAPLSCSQ